jgi:hypothetical protein
LRDDCRNLDSNQPNLSNASLTRYQWKNDPLVALG